MFSLRDLRFVLCSLEVGILRAQRVMGFFYLNYPQINAVAEKYDHMVCTIVKLAYKTTTKKLINNNRFMLLVVIINNNGLTEVVACSWFENVLL